MNDYQTLVIKLDPSYVMVSPKFTAILGYILGQRWSAPELTGMAITSDGFLLGQTEGDIGMNEMLGDKSDLVRNLEGVGDAVGLTTLQQKLLIATAASRIEGWTLYA